MVWKWELRRRVKNRAGLERRLSLTESERRWFEESARAEGGFDLRITPYYLSLAADEPDDPIRRQCVPTAEELSALPWELRDPLGEEKHKPLSRLIHRYPDRALLLVTDECAVACRHCFRRSFAGGGRGAIRTGDLQEAAVYLRSHPEIRELLLSGGDPLTLDDQKLHTVIDTIRAARPGIVLRLGSRMPAVLPSRITRLLARGLAIRQPLWFVVHINHPRELTAECTEAFQRLAGAGVPLLSQTVLLRGVNDDPAVLEDLFRGLTARRVKPYYLFQGDLARGTGHFRVPLARGRDIMRELRRRLSAMALPVYAVDLPGGGGKIPLTESYLKGEDAESYIFESVEGGTCRYPKEG